jgi:hypothetical protein
VDGKNETIASVLIGLTRRVSLLQKLPHAILNFPSEFSLIYSIFPSNLVRLVRISVHQSEMLCGKLQGPSWRGQQWNLNQTLIGKYPYVHVNKYFIQVIFDSSSPGIGLRPEPVMTRGRLFKPGMG